MKLGNLNRNIDFPSAVLMDLDNTIYDYDFAHEAALASAGAKCMAFADINAAQFADKYSLAKKTVKSRVKNTAASHSRIMYFKELLESLGYGPQVLLSLELEQHYWRVFFQNMNLFDGVFDFLEELRLQKVPVGLVTDLTLQIQLRKISFLGLQNCFSSIVTSEEVGVEKPGAEPFLLAVEKLGIASGPIWFIGDDHTKDVQGSRRHLDAITFQKLHGKIKPGLGENRADVEFRNFDDLTALLNNIARS